MISLACVVPGRRTCGLRPLNDRSCTRLSPEINSAGPPNFVFLRQVQTQREHRSETEDGAFETRWGRFYMRGNGSVRETRGVVFQRRIACDVMWLVTFRSKISHPSSVLEILVTIYMTTCNHDAQDNSLNSNQVENLKRRGFCHFEYLIWPDEYSVVSDVILFQSLPRVECHFSF